ncbi:MAG: Mrp/NBP35 family ATP-binding protein [Methanomicrobiaceae archaeon]|nr:Mrp/NBP35 family ATP-binding protein [Methanomicrobiaceae archaeon]
MADNSQECNHDCANCASAVNCDDPAKKAAGLPEKVQINVGHVILVLSGKGGVGKSTVAANLAMALSNHGFNTGLVDLDIHGPNIPKMLGIEEKRLASYDGNKIEPVRITGTLGVVSMAFLLPEKSTPVIWRGPMKMTAIRQFLEDVNWGDLDYLVVDLPPGTGDEALTIAQLAPNIDGAVIVTTPQEVAILDSSKAVRFVQMIGLEVLGIVENMSGMVCPHCGKSIDLFGTGGGERAAQELRVPFLGRIPLDPEMRKAGDEGRPFIIKGHQTEASTQTWKHVDEVMENLIAVIEKKG